MAHDPQEQKQGILEGIREHRLIAGGDAKGTYLIAATATELYVFTAKKRHHDRVDDRSGA